MTKKMTRPSLRDSEGDNNGPGPPAYVQFGLRKDLEKMDRLDKISPIRTAVPLPPEHLPKY